MAIYREPVFTLPLNRDISFRRGLRLRQTPPPAGGARGGGAERATQEHPRTGDTTLTRDTLALVMAGGRGTRLHDLAARRAKPAVPFGGKFRIIDFTLSNCINSGIRRVGVLLQYEGHSLIRHLQQGWSFSRGHFGECIELLPAEQREAAPGWYAGTADAVYQNIDFIREQRPRFVLVLAGDHIYKMDYGRMLAQHVASGAQVTVGCVEVALAQATEFGVMAVDRHDRISAFAEKPDQPQPMPDKPGMALASMGIYVFDTEFLIEQLLADAQDPQSSHDFGHEVVPSMIERGGAYAYRFHDLHDPSRQGYWRDVGHVDAYWRANLELTAAQPEFNLYDSSWPIWTHQLQVPPAKLVLDPAGSRGGAVDSVISDGCVVSGASIRRSVLFVNATVQGGSQIDEALLLPEVRIGRQCRIRRAVIDEGCVLPDGTVIGEDPEIDARRFHVTPGGVTLVTRSMLTD